MDVLEIRTTTLKKANMSYMEHTPILHIYHLNGRTQIFKFGTRVLLTREEDGAIVAWVLVMQKKRVINNMTKLKLDQHHLKIQY